MQPAVDKIADSSNRMQMEDEVNLPKINITGGRVGVVNGS